MASNSTASADARTPTEGSPPRISVVLPAHDEAANLADLVERLAKTLNAHTHELIIVDDGSSDHTWEIILGLRQRHPQLRAVRLTRNFGQQSALLAGLTAAKGDAIISMDADGQHPPELLPSLIALWEAGCPVVQTVRTGSGDRGVAKRWASRLFYRVLSLIAGVKVPEGSADFRLLARPVVAAILRSAGPLLFLRGLIPWLGYPVSYVPFEAPPRAGGSSSYTWRRMLELSVDGLMSFSLVPLRVSILLGITLSALSFLYLIYIVIIFLVSSRVVPGWASVAGLLSLLGGIQLLMIGVLGEYLGRVFLSNLHRPPFVVREEI
jgi:glycosyltransferase involved in cell wall biosynthesis